MTVNVIFRNVFSMLSQFVRSGVRNCHFSPLLNKGQAHIQNKLNVTKLMFPIYFSNNKMKNSFYVTINKILDKTIDKIIISLS